MIPPRTMPATAEERDAMVDAAIRATMILVRYENGVLEVAFETYGNIRRAVYAALDEAMWPPSPAEEQG